MNQAFGETRYPAKVWAAAAWAAIGGVAAAAGLWLSFAQVGAPPPGPADGPAAPAASRS